MKTTKRIRFGLFITSLGLVTAMAPTASAETFGADVNLHFVTKNESTLFSPDLSLRVPVSGLTLELAWAFSFFDGITDSQITPMNPFLAAHYDLSLGVAELRVGLGVSAPAFQIGDSPTLDGATSAANLGVRGMRNMWMYTPETIGLVLPARAKLNVPGVDLMVEAAYFILIPTIESADTESGFQIGGEVAFPVAVVVDLGLRALAVYVPTAGGDNFQLSAEPFVRLDAGPAEISAGFLLNLDHPFGFSFDDGRIWGFRVGAGFSF